MAAARKKALDAVQQAMLDARKGRPNCVECDMLRGAKGERRTLQMPSNGPNGSWVGGAPSADGNGVFKFTQPKTLPDGRTVSEIEFRNGNPNFDSYVTGEKYQLWEVSGNAVQDERQLKAMLRQQNPSWNPPERNDYTLHHFEDGSVGYVPDVLHDKRIGGVAHTGGNSMINNELF